MSYFTFSLILNNANARQSKCNGYHARARTYIPSMATDIISFLYIHEIPTLKGERHVFAQTSNTNQSNAKNKL